MTGLEQIQETIDKTADISEELGKMMECKTDKEMLSLAHRIVAKLKVKNEVVFEIIKLIKEKENEGKKANG